MSKEDDIYEFVLDYFMTLRLERKYHLGLGDIRLTVAQQEELAKYIYDIVKRGEDGNSMQLKMHN